MSTARDRHSSTLLPNSNVLICGGNSLQSCDIYNLTTNSFRPTSSMASRRSEHTSTLLQEIGKVLICGGRPATSTCELYDIASETFTSTSSLMSIAREGHSAVLLPSMSVLHCGGKDELSNTTNSCDLYNSTTGLFTKAFSMTNSRERFDAVLLPSSFVFACAGQNNIGALTFSVSSCEVFDSQCAGFSMRKPPEFICGGDVQLSGTATAGSGPGQWSSVPQIGFFSAPSNSSTLFSSVPEGVVVVKWASSFCSVSNTIQFVSSPSARIQSTSADVCGSNTTLAVLLSGDATSGIWSGFQVSFFLC